MCYIDARGGRLQRTVSEGYTIRSIESLLRLLSDVERSKRSLL